MAKKIIFNEDSRESIKRGIDTVANAVRVTIGPYGRNVVLEKSYGGPTITNDGVTIAKDISLKEPFENMGAEIIKEVASKTNDNAGDGTSTSVLLTHALIEEGIKRVNKGVNTLSIRGGMERAHNDAIESLNKMKNEVKDEQDIIRVATVAAESDKMGKIIAETISKVGREGVVTVEESRSLGIESDVVEGLEIDSGYVSPYMVTNTERLEAEYSDTPVLIVDKKISAIKEILPFLEKLAQSGTKDLILIADDVDGEALTTFVLNKLRGTFNVLAIKAPGFGDSKNQQLEDIAVALGAKVVSSEKGMKLDTVETDVLGRVSKIVARKDKTILVGGGDTKDAVSNRVKELREQIKNIDAKYEKEKLEERMAKLSGGVAVIRVGASTESEMKYLKLKIEDAVSATKAALEEGIVPGGGATLAHIAHNLRKVTSDDSYAWKNRDEKDGYMIVVEALESPLRQIADNTLGEKEGVAIVREVQNKTEQSNNKAGYNAATKQFVNDMFQEGIIDPVKVTRSALQNAISAAGIFLTIEAAIVDIPEENKADNNPGGPMGMGGMGGF